MNEWITRILRKNSYTKLCQLLLFYRAKEEKKQLNHLNEREKHKIFQRIIQLYDVVLQTAHLGFIFISVKWKIRPKSD